MKNQKSLSKISDEHLVDMLDASVMSYNVYVLENTKIKQHQLLQGLRDSNVIAKIFANFEYSINEKNIINKKRTITEDGFLVQTTRGFLSELREDVIFKEIQDKILANLMTNYDAKYRSKLEDMRAKEVTKDMVSSATQIWEMAKEDTQILMDREIFSFLSKKYKMNKNNDFFKYLEKSSDGKNELIVNKQLSSESYYLNDFIINEQKVMLVAKDRMKDMLPVTSYTIGRHNPSFVNTNLGQSKTLYTDNKGVFLVGNPGENIGASFSAFLREEKGQIVLHIGFRGTDTNAKDMMDYVTKDYLNMERQFNEIEPIIKEIIDITKHQHSKDKPYTVKLSGHSLGAAMVEKFLEKNKDTIDINYSGIAIASPGALNKAQGIINVLDKMTVNADKYLHPIMATGVKLVNNSLVGGANVAIGLASGAIRTTKNVLNTVGGISKTKFITNLGINMIEYIFPYKEADSRLINVNHKNDLVPQLGSLANRVQKDEIQLLAVNAEESHKNHKVYNYYSEIAQEVLKRPNLTKQLVDVFAVEEAFKQTAYIGASKQQLYLQRTMQLIGERAKNIKDKLLTNEDTIALKQAKL